MWYFLKKCSGKHPWPHHLGCSTCSLSTKSNYVPHLVMLFAKYICNIRGNTSFPSHDSENFESMDHGLEQSVTFTVFLLILDHVKMIPHWPSYIPTCTAHYLIPAAYGLPHSYSSPESHHSLAVMWLFLRPATPWLWFHQIDSTWPI